MSRNELLSILFKSLGVFMSYYKKITNNLIRILLSFMMIIFSFSLCASNNNTENDVVYLDPASINKVSCIENNCFFPSESLSNKNIHIVEQVHWNRGQNLVLQTKGNIIFKENGKLIGKGDASIALKSGMEPGEKAEDEYNGTVVFEGKSTQMEIIGKGKVKIYYNPNRGKTDHRYLNPGYNYYRDHVKAENIKFYMLVNDVYDLQSIGARLSESFALSQDIEAAETGANNWKDDKGFEPLREGRMSFSGDFDGNGYSIKNLFINRNNENDVGLFGECGKSDILHNTIENLTLENFNITGDHYVGSLAGFAAHCDLLNITVVNPIIKSRDVAGGLVGTVDRVQAIDIQIIGDEKISAYENVGFVIGSTRKSKILLLFETEQRLLQVLKKYNHLGLGNRDNQTEICLKTKDNQTEAQIKIQDEKAMISLKTGVGKVEVPMGGNLQAKELDKLIMLIDLVCKKKEK